jgi:hypothetical protein
MTRSLHTSQRGTTTDNLGRTNPRMRSSSANFAETSGRRGTRKTQSTPSTERAKATR